MSKIEVFENFIDQYQSYDVINVEDTIGFKKYEGHQNSTSLEAGITSHPRSFDFQNQMTLRKAMSMLVFSLSSTSEQCDLKI